MRPRFRLLFLLSLPFALAASGCGSSSSRGGTTADGGTQVTDGATVEDSGTSSVPAPDAAGETGDATSGADAGLPPIDPNAFLNSLTSAQLGELCDWQFSHLGGYSATIQCTNTVRPPTTQATCVAALSYNQFCVVTVGQYEGCIMAEESSQGCDRPGPDCMMLEMCTTSDAGT